LHRPSKGARTDPAEIAPTLLGERVAHSHCVRESRSSDRTALRWRPRPCDARVARVRSGPRATRPTRSTSRIPRAFSRGQALGVGRLHRDSLPQRERSPAGPRASHRQAAAEIAPTLLGERVAHSHCVRESVPATGPRCDGALDRVTLGSREYDPGPELRGQRAQPRGSPGSSRAVRRSVSVASTGDSLPQCERSPARPRESHRQAKESSHRQAK
jgi:hypothetical protein